MNAHSQKGHIVANKISLLDLCLRISNGTPTRFDDNIVANICRGHAEFLAGALLELMDNEPCLRKVLSKKFYKYRELSSGECDEIVAMFFRLHGKFPKSK